MIRSLLACLAWCLLICCAQTLGAATYPAAALTPAAVQAAIDLATDGDTVTLPTGTSAPWATGVSIQNKSITITGAGVGVTIITDGGNTGTNTSLFSFSQMGVKSFEISGFTINSNNTAYSGAGIAVGPSRGFRIHHIDFNNLYRRGIRMGSQSGVYCTGLIDHCTFRAPYNASAQGVTINGSDADYPPAQNPLGAWAITPTFGDANAVYIEDCTFDFAFANDAAVEWYNGGRGVLRYCTIINSMMGVHGNDSGTRSGCTYEFYENTISCTIGSSGGQLQVRGGTGVFFNNSYTASGTNFALLNKILLDAYRATGNLIYSGLPNGFLNGSSRTDGNTAVATGSGTHTAATSTTTLTDSTKSWTVNAWSRTAEGANPVGNNKPYYIWNRTDGSGGWALSNTATTLTVTLTGGVDNRWEEGDQYVITFGYPGLDQCGWAGATLFKDTNGNNTSSSSAVRYSTQTLTPLYQWNNTFNGGAGLPFVVGHSSGIYAGVWPNGNNFIVENREFYQNTPKPGYTPYTYPHPLQGDGTPVITVNPVSQTVVTGETAALTVEAIGTPSPTLQWYKNGVSMAGRTSATLEFSPVVSNDAGSYYAIATNSVGSATSSAAVLTVSAGASAPVITTQPQSLSIPEGTPATFTADASGSPVPTWQWYKNNVEITGQVNPQLFIASVSSGDAGNYKATATNTGGTATTNTVSLAVTAVSSAPSITANPSSRSVAAGGNTTFTASATGNPSPAWQWYFNGALMPGKTASNLTLSGVAAGNAGSYYARASNSAGTAQSASATLTVTTSPETPLKAPVITNVK